MKTENLDGEVIYEYYTIENFEQTGVSSEVWTKVVDQYDGILTDDDKYSEIEQAIASV